MKYETWQGSTSAGKTGWKDSIVIGVLYSNIVENGNLIV